jgi:transposase
MSIPVVRPSLTAAFIACVGDEDRFRKSAEVANYAGLTPALDCSGDTERYGHIRRGRWWD